MAQLQVATIKTEEDIRTLLDFILRKLGVRCCPNLIGEFIFVVDTKRFLLDKSIVTSSAIHLVCKSANVPREYGDYMEYSVNPDGSGYTFIFRAKPFVGTVYPDYRTILA